MGFTLGHLVGLCREQDAGECFAFSRTLLTAMLESDGISEKSRDSKTQYKVLVSISFNMQTALSAIHCINCKNFMDLFPDVQSPAYRMVFDRPCLTAHPLSSNILHAIII